MKRFFELFILSLLMLTTVSIPCIFAQTNSNVEEVVQSNTQFAIDLYKELKTGKGNLFFSPYSISSVLALTYGGARGETAKQMADVLHFSLEAGKLHSSFAEIQKILNNIEQKGKIELSIANSLWPMDKYPFLEEYLELAGDYYRTEITPVNYLRDPENARRKINSWIERETNNKIRNIIPDISHLPSLTRLVLVNAIYFKGEWTTQFNKSATTRMTFHPGNNETINVSMMNQTCDLKYGEDVILQVLEMPYAGDNLSMVILLPREIDGLRDLEEILSADSLREWSRNSYERPVEVYLPRFKITFEVKLNDVLKAMGMNDAFHIVKADLSGMDGSNMLYIQCMFHKAFVAVNEKGTEAAATTMGCFPPGTEVLTNDGLCPIETVTAGAKVYAYDLTTEEWVLARILKRQSFQYEGDMVTIQIGNSTIQSTGNHPFYVMSGDSLAFRPLPQDISKVEQVTTEHGRWVEARDLKEGDILKNNSGNGLIISSISSRHEETVVYNLNIEGYHNYAVDKKCILVHNKGQKEAHPEPIIFRADHPFIFLIRDNVTESILFMGRVNNPSVE